MSEIVPTDGTSPFDAIKRIDLDGEYWDGREYMPLLDYDKWERFADVIEKARVAIAAAGADPDVHASHLREASGRTFRGNYRLTRYGCYLVAMSADGSKRSVAEAKTYFAVKTREAEIAAATFQIPTNLGDALRLAAEQYDRAEAEKTGRELAERRVTELAPAASAWHGLVDKTGDVSVGEAAKALKRAGANTGPNRLFRTLEELGWIWKDARKDWRVKQSAIETGRLSERLTGTYEHPDTGERVAAPPQVRVTFKGLDALHAHFTGVRVLPVRRQLPADGGAA